MMNRESSRAAASAAMSWLANQLEFLGFSSQSPGLATGKLAHICERLAPASSVLKSCITGRSSTRGNRDGLDLAVCRRMFAPADFLSNRSTNPWGD
jgi:hypothetical protein